MNEEIDKSFEIEVLVGVKEGIYTRNPQTQINMRLDKSGTDIPQFCLI